MEGFFLTMKQKDLLSNAFLEYTNDQEPYISGVDPSASKEYYYSDLSLYYGRGKNCVDSTGFTMENTERYFYCCRRFCVQQSGESNSADSDAYALWKDRGKLLFDCVEADSSKVRSRVWNHWAGKRWTGFCNGIIRYMARSLKKWAAFFRVCEKQHHFRVQWWFCWSSSSIFKIIVHSIQPEDWSGGRKHQEILTGSDKFQRRFRPRNKKRDFDRTQSLFSKSRIYSNPGNVTSSTEDPWKAQAFSFLRFPESAEASRFVPCHCSYLQWH